MTQHDAPVTLEVWRSASGQWAGRAIADGAEFARFAGCTSAASVEQAAIDSGIVPASVERIDAELAKDIVG